MKTFQAFISENTLLDTHMRYHEAGIPLPDRDDITEYPGGRHGYPTGPDTFAIHSIGGNTGQISHYKSTPAGDVLHNEKGPALFQTNAHGTWTDNEFWLNGNIVSRDTHAKRTQNENV